MFYRTHLKYFKTLNKYFDIMRNFVLKFSIQEQNIWSKLRNPSKIGQEHENLPSAFT